MSKSKKLRQSAALICIQKRQETIIDDQGTYKKGQFFRLSSTLVYLISASNTSQIQPAIGQHTLLIHGLPLLPFVPLGTDCSLEIASHKQRPSSFTYLVNFLLGKRYQSRIPSSRTGQKPKQGDQCHRISKPAAHDAVSHHAAKAKRQRYRAAIPSYII